MHSSEPRRDISVIISTYNRSGLLKIAIESVLNQQAGSPSYELIVVNNNSTDNTEKVARAFERVRYVFEPRQGLSYGRNAGIGAAQGDILAFTDDDIEVSSDWISSIQRAFSEHPDAAYIGGPVIPRWTKPQPKWADEKFGSFALQNLGDSVRRIDSSYQCCLVGANLACRRDLIDKIGAFDPATQRVKNSIGSLEDHEWQLRIWNGGLRGKYVPYMKVFSPIEPDRYLKSYHRTWYFGHGKFRSKLDDPAFEASSFRFMNTPGHVYREFVQASLAYLKERVRGDSNVAFHLQCDALERLGFISARWKRTLTGRRDARNA